MIPTSFQPLYFKWFSLRTYLFTLLFVVGNILLPQLCHLLPSGGQILLPIYFFTLIAAYKFGWKVGLLTAILSPLVNSALFGMPLVAALPVILIKSCLLAVAASVVAYRSNKVSLLLILLVLVAYQIPGSLAEWLITKDFGAALADLTKGVPGILLQWIGGWLILTKLASYER